MPIGKNISGLFAGLSKAISSDVTVGRKGMNTLGLSGMVAKGTKRAKIMGPTASTRTANLVTGTGSGRRFIANKTYDAAHAMRGRAIVGYGGMGAAGISMASSRRSTGAYNPPRPTPMAPRGSGRFA